MQDFSHAAANKVTGTPHDLICREFFHHDATTFIQHCSRFWRLGSDRCIFPLHCEVLPLFRLTLVHKQNQKCAHGRKLHTAVPGRNFVGVRGGAGSCRVPVL